MVYIVNRRYRNIFKENTLEKVKILGFSLELFFKFFLSVFG